jgi:hypothetical protein
LFDLMQNGRPNADDHRAEILARVGCAALGFRLNDRLRLRW